ncbi:MAG: MogA/MoaB family molybdenum cofactor biosynthesis protein [Thermomicrobiales bacterium]|nr:MogA/MoaB family molybdenum cofactor biosynthesis protein [Thermomicrobiales bacterium]
MAVGVVTVSDTRTVQNDTGGALIVEFLEGAGHRVVSREIVTDDRERIVNLVLGLAADPEIDVIISTGGTGIARRDVTHQAVTSIMDRQIDGFGELFRMLSFDEIGSAAMLSRAVAGVVGSTAVFALPGSRNAIKLAMERLVLPEIAHVVFEIRK